MATIARGREPLGWEAPPGNPPETAYTSRFQDRQDLEDVLVRFFPGGARAVHHGRAHYGETLSGSALTVEFMKLVGVDVIFGIPGGASLPLSDALTHGHVEGAFRYVLTGHEQGAAFEAEGYAEASGRTGFCTATSGPGATNLITGLADAFRDSRPVFALTGNAASTAEPEAFQALDIVGITDGKATKASFQARRPEEVQAMLVRAYHTAVTGRPGSVLVDLPKDVQGGKAEMRPWEELIAAQDWRAPEGDEAALYATVRLLAGAERPVLYVGHGAALSGALEEVQTLARRYSIPVATTVHGLGTLPADDPLNLGMIGMHGTVVANMAPYLSDVTVALGARFDDRVVGGKPAHFAPHARIVHVDVDQHQLNRVRSADIAVHADVKLALRRMLAIFEELRQDLPRPDRRPWLEHLHEIQRAMPLPSYDRPEQEALTHEFVYGEVAAALRARAVSDVVTTFDVGTHQMKGAQWFPVSQPRSFITSGGMGSMGCALPMAVGASFARPGATVLAAVGDGGCVMSSHEWDTIGSYQLPVKILLFDDSALGMVTNWHSLFFEGRWLTSDRRRRQPAVPVDVEALKRSLAERLDAATSKDDVAGVLCRATAALARDEWPLFAAGAAAYGIAAERVHTKAQFQEALQRLLDAPGPYLMHIILPAQNQVYPLMEPGSTPQELIWQEQEPGSGVKVYVRERFDYEARSLRALEIGEIDERSEGTGHLPPADPSAF